METPIRQRFMDGARNYLHSAQASGKHKDKMRSRAFIESDERLSSLFLLDATERIFRQIERQDDAEARKSGLRESPQMRFAGEQFAILFTRGFAERLPIREGRKIGKVRLEEMTMTQMRQSATLLRQRAANRSQKAAQPDEARAAWLEATAEEMSPYAPARGERLKYSDYIELRTAGIAPAKVSRIESQKAVMAHA